MPSPSSSSSSVQHHQVGGGLISPFSLPHRAPSPSPPPPPSSSSSLSSGHPDFTAPPSLIDFGQRGVSSLEQRKQLEQQLFDLDAPSPTRSSPAAAVPTIHAMPNILAPPASLLSQPPSLLAVQPPTINTAAAISLAAAAGEPTSLLSPTSQAAAPLPDIADLFEFNKLEALAPIAPYHHSPLDSPTRPPSSSLSSSPSPSPSPAAPPLATPAFFGGDQALLGGVGHVVLTPSSLPGSSSGTGLSSAQRITRIEEVYALGGELGRGTFGSVRVGVSHANGRRYAIKQIQKSTLTADILQKLELEIEILKRVNHQNIVNLEAVFQTLDSVFLVAEIVEGGNLFARMKRMKTYCEKDASVLVRNMCSALAYLHKLGIVHRDVKPENILLVSEHSNSDVKLADFGLSRYFSGSASLFTRVGTPLYVAPEILGNKGYGPLVDLWAVGVLTYCLLSGKPPFPCHDIAVLYQYILAGKYSFSDPVWQGVSTQAKEFIRALLQVEPSLRLTAERALKHPWVSMPPGTLQPVQSFDQAVGKYLDLLAV